MPANVIASIGGNTVNGATSYRVVFPAGDPIVRRKTVTYAKRRNAGPQVVGRSWEPLEIKLLISAADAATSYATLKTVIEQWFQPWSNTTSAIVAAWHDGTPVSVDAELLELRPVQDAGAVQTVLYEATVSVPLPIWRKVTPTVTGPNPPSATNAGNAATQPSIALTQSTHKTLRACTVAAAVGFGFSQYPILFALADTVATSANTFVYVNGVSVPCYVIDSGGVASGVWACVDCASDGSLTYVDIIYGSGITNPRCQTLVNPGMFTTASSSNTSWRYTNWTISTYPDICGAWVPSRTAYDQGDMAYQLTSDGTSALFTLGAVSIGPTDYDSMTMRTPTGADSSGTSIDSFSRTTSGFAGTLSQAFVRSRARGTDKWTDLWTTRANSSVSTDIAFTDGAIAFTAGIENDGSAGDPATVSFTDAGVGARWDLVSTTDPTVTVAAAANVDYYNGTLTVGAYVLTFDNCFVPDGTLTIDCQNKTVESSVGGAKYNLPTFSDPDIWAALVPGVNTITDGLTATAADTWTHRDGWA
jgi:hypothetical protein